MKTQEEIMKKIPIIIFSLGILLFSTNSYSRDSEIAGALIGAGSGAVIGYAAGGNAESLIIGTTIGGVLGATAGHVYNSGRRFAPAPPPHHSYIRPQKFHYYRPHNFHGHQRIVHKHYYRDGHRYVVSKDCYRYIGKRHYRDRYHNKGGRDRYRQY